MVLRKKGRSDVLIKSQTVCMHSNSLGKKGQYARTNCINFFNKTYQNNLCSLVLQIGLFLPNEFECIQTVWLFIKMSDWPFLRNTINMLSPVAIKNGVRLHSGCSSALTKLGFLACAAINRHSGGHLRMATDVRENEK